MSCVISAAATLCGLHGRVERQKPFSNSGCCCISPESLIKAPSTRSVVACSAYHTASTCVRVTTYVVVISDHLHINYVCRAAIGSENEDGSKKFVIRPYTPTSPKDAKGYFDLVVKVYEQGKMSKHFGELKVLHHPRVMLCDANCTPCCTFVKPLQMMCASTAAVTNVSLHFLLLRHSRMHAANMKLPAGWTMPLLPFFGSNTSCL